MPRRSLLVSCLLANLLLLMLAGIQSQGGLIGTSISADLQASQSAAVITQFTSPQTVVDPGVEFTGQFTPNAGNQPLSVQLVNSFSMSMDISAMSLQIIMSEVPGSIQGFHNNFGAPLRLDVSNLSFPSGTTLNGITLTNGPAPYDALVTSPTSIAIDFQDFSARTMDFDLVTSFVPEPTLPRTAAAATCLVTLASVRHARRTITGAGGRVAR